MHMSVDPSKDAVVRVRAARFDCDVTVRLKFGCYHNYYSTVIRPERARKKFMR